ncbi:hypothetical protein APY94_03750 [Thermococcus celericrescens]|uniref:NYN domain-containing protein n=1 Tax=Thermococcus celericrescens TaxID=227598 RepID=A0A117ITJ6_9EURY|nr:NYN domain-containing protein [Thermococcus celericrescens]KUH33998.1 hypothetical protein APY94_03750 [Thermococcus celericrescens]
MNGAMFVDGDNICMHFKNSKKIHPDEDIEWEDLFFTFETQGVELTMKKLYMTTYGLHPKGANNLLHLGFDLRPTEEYGGKSLTDGYLMVDAMDALDHNPIDVLIIVSGDKDYLPLARKARARGIRVIFVAFEDDTAEIIKREFEFMDITPYVKFEYLVGNGELNVGEVVEVSL